VWLERAAARFYEKHRRPVTVIFDDYDERRLPGMHATPSLLRWAEETPHIRVVVVTDRNVLDIQEADGTQSLSLHLPFLFPRPCC
jgi:hypothetical protein